VFFNVFQSLIVVLYVLDNETNTVVRISVVIGLAIECWKIKKVVDVKVMNKNNISPFNRDEILLDLSGIKKKFVLNFRCRRKLLTFQVNCMEHGSLGENYLMLK
jgi:hypothetical protein